MAIHVEERADARITEDPGRGTFFIRSHSPAGAGAIQASARPKARRLEMFQKRMQRAAMILFVAALLLTAPLQARTSREPGLLETAWSWLGEWFTGISAAQPAFRPIGPSGDDGGAIDPDG